MAKPGTTGRKGSMFVRFVGVTAVVLLVIAAAIAAALFLFDGFLFEPMNEAAGPPSLPGAATIPGDSDLAAGTGERIFEIRPNQSLRTISRRMVGEGLARNALAVELYGRLQGYSARLQAGRYLVSSQMAPVDILEKIITGDAVFDELTITIPEGWSANDIELYLERLGLFSKEEFAKAVVMQPIYRDFELLVPLEDDTILDGYLFPDTYRIFEDSTPQTIVRRMLDNFHRRITPALLAEVEASVMTLHEILTLASIVQAEANGAEQMYDVAGVFANRLRDRIRLESDATVNYVLGTSKRQPTFADTRVAHPYNTYENYGLPPGPIGNPGLDAIRAAIDPAEHEFFFFLHPIDGRIILSRTFAEHLENKARYLD